MERARCRLDILGGFASAESTVSAFGYVFGSFASVLTASGTSVVRLNTGTTVGALTDNLWLKGKVSGAFALGAIRTLFRRETHTK